MNMMRSGISVLSLRLVAVLLSLAVAVEPETEMGVEQYLLPVSVQPTSRLHPLFPQRTGQRTGTGIRQKKRSDEEASEQVSNGSGVFTGGVG